MVSGGRFFIFMCVLLRQLEKNTIYNYGFVKFHKKNCYCFLMLFYGNQLITSSSRFFTKLNLNCRNRLLTSGFSYNWCLNMLFYFDQHW